MRIAYLSRFLLALSLSALASTALGAVPQPLPTIRGIVVDPTGAPLPGAVVSLDLPGMTTVTAADGRFAITPGTPGKRRVRISLAGFQPSEVTVVLPETASEGAIEELRITLVPVPRTQAQPAPASDYRWSVDVGIGFDNSISGNINSGAIGTLNGQAVVFTKNTYEDVYGTGFHLRFGGGYMLNEDTEVRACFTYQSLGADLARMGDIGLSNLYGQYDDYKTFGLDFGYRRYSRAALGPRDAVRGGYARHRVHQRDRRPARGAAGERGAERDRFLRSHRRVHPRRERRDSRPNRRSSRPRLPGRPSLRDGTLSGRCPRWYRPRGDQRRQRAVDDPVRHRRPHPLLRRL